MRLKQVILIFSAVVSVGIIGGALLVVQNRKEAVRAATEAREPRPVSKAELAAATGKDNKPCFVAVDSTVYEIKDFSLWRDGQHKPSAGMAYCGADLTKVIDKSPHGRKILDVLVVIGPLQ